MVRFATRWIVQSPANNIDVGPVVTGGLNRINCPPRRAPRALSSDAKYSQGKQITEKIVDVLSIQPSTTHKLAMQWLTGFYDALHTGKLEEFPGQNLCATSGFNALSQVSSVGSVTVSQLSFADTGVRRVPEDKPMCDVTAWTDLEEKAPVPVVGPTPSQHGDAVGRSPADPITLASPPKRKGLTRRGEKHEASTGELQVANKLRLRISEGRKSCAVKLSDMAILKGPYSRRTTMPFIERLSLPSVEVAGKLDVRSFNIGQPVPVTKAIPQLEKIEEAIAAIDNKSNKALLARWEDYGFATYGQLKLMARVIKARNKFKLVEDTMKWIDSLAFRVASITPPFKDLEDVTKVDHKQAEDDLNLGRWYVGRHEQNGCEFLDFRENLWLHSGSIIGGLLALQSENLDVAIVNPRFHDFDDADQKMRTAKGYGAANARAKFVISVINLGHHWGAFLVNTETKICYLFDPMQLSSNLSTLKEAVLTVVENMLDMTDQLDYQVIAHCQQKDSTSCGIREL
ncbi:hypothetical protein PF007_g24825 [Phytophthora fragariae]|uniref:Uncharacterized protein n=1 Tax=Phytophthora fragariae TaxID=53985 RepID=A0A6A3QHA2_9STRA|nr:hypothetical protein PF007_g24825 [Phytophthora fragariae]